MKAQELIKSAICLVVTRVDDTVLSLPTVRQEAWNCYSIERSQCSLKNHLLSSTHSAPAPGVSAPESPLYSTFVG